MQCKPDLYQGWAKYGPRAACGTRDHFLWPAGTYSYRNINSYREYVFLYRYLVAYFILLSRKSDQCAVRARLGVANICLPHQDGVIPVYAFPNGTTSKLAGLFSTLSLQC